MSLTYWESYSLTLTDSELQSVHILPGGHEMELERLTTRI